MSSRTLYAQHPVSLRIFHLSPVLAYVFLSPGKSSTLQCNVFYTLQPKLMLSDSVGLEPVFKFQEPRGSGVDEALVVWSLQGRCLKNYAIHRRRNRTFVVLIEINP